MRIPFHSKLALPYFPLIALGFLLILSLNIGYLDCQGLPFAKGDIDNYLNMFDIRDSDIAHRFYVSQMNGLHDILGFDYPHLLFYTSVWKAYFIFPFVLFLFFCSMGQDIGRSGLAVILLYTFSWWMPMHLILGLHAQFDSMIFFFLFATASNLRRHTGGFELELVYWSSIMISIMSHYYIIVVYWIYFMFYGKHKKYIFIAGLSLMFILPYFNGGDPSVFIGLDAKVSIYTALMMGGVLWLGEYEDTSPTDRRYILALGILGLLSDNHRLFIYALPYLAYHFAIRYEQYGMPKQIIFFLGAIYYSYLSLIFWLSNMRAELRNERGIDLYCFDLLTR